MEKITKFTPAWDKRNYNGKNYGVHGVDMYMVLKGELGAVEFQLSTNWYLPHVQNEFINKSMNKPLTDIEIECRFLPNPTLVGYHSPKPLYEDEPIACNECEHLDGKPCYFGATYTTLADRAYAELLEHGSDGVWRLLEGHYVDIFGELK